MLALSPGAGRRAAGVGDRASVGAQPAGDLRAGRGHSGDGRRAWSISRRLEQPACGAGSRPLVSLMLANNETGVVQPVAKPPRWCTRPAACCMSTRCRAPGRIACDFKALGADLMTLSAHKIGGPAGRRRADQARRRSTLDAADPGGGQERGARAGTENVAGIAGFGAAAAAARPICGDEAAPDGGAARPARGGPQGDRAARRSFSARTADRLPNTTLFAVPGMKAETAVIAFDLEGVAVSSGAACSSGKVHAVPCAGGHGRAPELCPRRDARQPGLFNHRVPTSRRF